jgi:hypothetical protein
VFVSPRSWPLGGRRGAQTLTGIFIPLVVVEVFQIVLA